MADQPANVPDPRARIIQRCPNCEARADVSTFVAGALVRCARCGVRFQVQGRVSIERKKTPPPAQNPPAPQPQTQAAPLQNGGQNPPPPNQPALWPDASEPRWDALGLGDAKTLTSDPSSRNAQAPRLGQGPLAARSPDARPVMPAARWLVPQLLVQQILGRKILVSRAGPPRLALVQRLRLRKPLRSRPRPKPLPPRPSACRRHRRLRFR